MPLATKLDAPQALTRRRVVIICLCIFCAATGVRLLQWQNNLHTIDQMMWRLTARYKQEAQTLLDGDAAAFLQGSRNGPDTGILMHPPGYPVLIAFIYKLTGNSDTALRAFQILCDAGAAVLITLITLELLPWLAAVIAGLLVAFSPQLAYNSLLLLPDSLSALPILLAVYLSVRALRRPRLTTIIAAGAAIGISCWLRANALLLAPFLSLLIIALFERGRRLAYAAALSLAALLVIAPITLRNLIVFHSFIPVSLSAGQNLVAGIADYDPQKRFGMEAYDDAACRQEAAMYNRPDYAEDLYRPDGIIREHLRTARALGVIRSHKLWFAGVMLRRALSMLEYEEVPVVSAEPSVTNPLQITNETELAWSASPSELMQSHTSFSPQAELSLSEDGRALRLAGDDSGQGRQIASLPIELRGGSDYLLRLPVRVEQGRVVIRIETVNGRTLLASATIPDAIARDALVKDSMPVVEMPFVSARARQVRVVIVNAQGAGAERTSMQAGTMELFRLGAASYLWTRYPRLVVKSVQKFFTTAWMLTLALAGTLILALMRRWRVLAVTLAVPAYYLCIHSPLHMEHRYALAMHYFFSMLVAVALYRLAALVLNIANRARSSRGRTIKAS